MGLFDFFKKKNTTEKEVNKETNSINALQNNVEPREGLSIKQAERQNIFNTWGAIIGFETQSQDSENKILLDYFNQALHTARTLYSVAGYSVFDLDYKDIAIRFISEQNSLITLEPIVKTDYTIDITIREVIEWTDPSPIDGLVKAKGRDTFGITFLATDYAFKRNMYLTQEKLNVRISGIVFVLDVFATETNPENTPQYDPNFTCYLPTESLPNNACFDFIGKLEDYREINFMNNNKQKAYILKMKIITHEIEDFFTIDMYVTPENMRFSTLEKGMKLTGMFQMQGQIKD